MASTSRFRYSKWDGTQVGFDLDADAVLEEITDDLLYHGDLHAALRRMMQQGFRDRNGDQVMGMRDLMERLRRRRRDQLERYDLGGVYEEIAESLREVLDMERQGLDELAREARESGDARRQEITDQVVEERNLQLDMLPPDLAGMVQELQKYEFTSSEAREKFDELMDQLRQEMAQSYFNQMSGAMQEMSPEAMQRMKDMLNDLNDLLAMKEAGQDTQPAFEQFMERYGDFFPENPATLDELLEIMAQRMAAMQAMMNSMTPEQRAQLQGLSEALLEDMDLRWQMDQLSGHLQQLFPQMGWERRYDFSGQDPLGFAEAAQMLNELGDLDQLEQMLRGASAPGALAEVDVDRARDLLGDDAARSLEQLSKLAQQLEEAGLINNKEGKLELTPKGLRKIGRNALSDLFSKLAKDKLGRHEMEHRGIGHERTYDTKPYEFGDPFNLQIERTVRNAIRRTGGGTPVRLTPDDFEIEQTEQSGAQLHRAHARPVAVDADARQLPRRQEGGHGPALADLDAVPAGLPRDRGLQRGRPRDHAGAAARGVVGLRLRHQHAARVPAEPPDARPPDRHQADHHDHRRRAHRPLRARDGPAVLQLPARAGDDRRDVARGRSLHEGRHPDQHVHARRHPVPAGLRREAHADEPRASLLHHA